MSAAIFREPQTHLMEATITQTETHLGQLCTLLATYTRKTAKLRDTGDLLVQRLGEFSNVEDQELRSSLRGLAEGLAVLQDYRHAQVDRLETRVVTPLKAYGGIVKDKRADLKKFTADRNRELKELKKLERLRLRNPSDMQSISQAETRAQVASANANHSTRQMEETIYNFQLKKLQDVKRIFADFITIEMLYHTKALEIYTNAFHCLESLDIDKDLEMFRARIQVHDAFLDNQTLQSSIPMITSLPRYPSPTPSSLRQHIEYPTRHRPNILQRQQEVDLEEDQENEEDHRIGYYASANRRKKRQ